MNSSTVNALAASGAGKRFVPCPRCGKETGWGEANLFRPFCSARCKQIDLGAWASEEYRISGSKQDEVALASDGFSHSN